MRRRAWLSSCAATLLLLSSGPTTAAAQEAAPASDPANYYSGLSEVDLSNVVNLSQMYLGVVDASGSTWCTSDVADEVRSAILSCLVAILPYKCNLYPNAIALSNAICYGDSAVMINGGFMDFAQASSVPTSYVVNVCIKETIRSGECASKLQAALPNAETLTYGSLTLSPTTSGRTATPAPALQYTRFPTSAPTPPKPVTNSPTTKSPTTPAPSLRPVAKTEEPTFTLQLDTQEPTKAAAAATSEPSASGPSYEPTREDVAPTVAAPNDASKPSKPKPTGSPALPNDGPDGAPPTPNGGGDGEDDGFDGAPLPEDDDDDTKNGTSTITASPSDSTMSPFTIALAAAGGSFLVLCLVGGVTYQSRKRKSRDINDNDNVDDQDGDVSGGDDLDTKSSTSGRWRLFSASVSNIYKSSDSDGTVVSPTQNAKPGYYFASSSQSSSGSPARPSKSLTEQDHLGPSDEVIDEEDLEQPSSPPPPSLKKHILSPARSVGSAASVPFRPLRDNEPVAASPSRAKTDTFVASPVRAKTDVAMATPVRAKADTSMASPARSKSDVSIASLDSMQHSESESSHFDMTFSDSSAELSDRRKSDKYTRKTNFIMKAYNSISPPPEQARSHSFLWRKKKNPLANFYPLYGGGSNRSASEDDDDDNESGASQENVLNVTDYELDVNWNPDDNSVSSSDRGDEIFSPTVSKEETMLLTDEGIEVSDVIYDGIHEQKEPVLEVVEDPKTFTFPESPDRSASPVIRDYRDSVETKNSPPRSGNPSTNSSLSSTQSDSPRKIPNSHSSSVNSSLSSGGDLQQRGRHHPPLSPRSRVVIDPLSEQRSTMYAVDTVPSEAMPTPRSHFADSGSHTDKPPTASREVPTADGGGGFMMLPVSPDYAEV